MTHRAALPPLLSLCLLSLALAGPDRPSAPAPPELDEVARAVADAVSAQDAAAIHSLCSPVVREALPLPQLEDVCRRIAEGLGKVERLERTTPPERQADYLLHLERGQVRLSLELDQAGRIMLVGFTPPPPAPPPVTRSRPLRLPVRGEWTVFWGGDSLEDNKHLTHANQRRAADLVVTDAEGKSSRGSGARNEDYYAYGREVLAAGAGAVITVVDGVPDNRPGSMNRYAAIGNAVLVEHEPGEVALYAHLQPGSIQVKVGQQVAAGDLLGRCGNSGNSSEPHLHFHLQDTRALQDGWGIEPVFAGVRLQRGGERSTPQRYTFLRGDRVAPADGE